METLYAINAPSTHVPKVNGGGGEELLVEGPAQHLHEHLRAALSVDRGHELVDGRDQIVKVRGGQVRKRQGDWRRSGVGYGVLRRAMLAKRSEATSEESSELGRRNSLLAHSYLLEQVPNANSGADGVSAARRAQVRDTKHGGLRGP